VLRLSLVGNVKGCDVALGRDGLRINEGANGYRSREALSDRSRRRRDSNFFSIEAGTVGTRWFATANGLETKYLQFAA
jgi:hypothetical protein